jgi:membrane fusion protein, heavy metal efflux system
MPFIYSAPRALRRCLFAWLVCFSGWSLILATPAQGGPGGDGHSHGDEAAPVSGASPRASMAGELYDVVAILKGGQLIFYVDRASDNVPVTTAVLEITAGPLTAKPEASADGTFRMTATSLPAGTHEIVVAIQANDGDDLLAGTLDVPAIAGHDKPHRDIGLSVRTVIATIGTLFAVVGLVLLIRWRRPGAAVAAIFLLLLFATLPPAMAGPGGDGHTHGDEAPAILSSDAPHRLPDGTVFLPKPTQRLLELRTLRAPQSEVRKSFVFPGRVIPNPNRSGIIQSINGGRVSAPDQGLPRLGQKVTKGQVVALVEPPVNAADETTISDKFGEIAQQIVLVETKLQRLLPLATSNAVPKSQVTDLETELDSLRRRLVSIKAQRRQPEELTAPIDGTIAVSRVVAGQVVAPQDQLFQVVDTQALWVEGFLFGEVEPASFVSASAIFKSGAHAVLRLEGVGHALQQHAVQVHFSIAAPEAAIRIGEPVRIVALGKETLSGIVLPREAVVRGANGALIVWTQTAPERFAPLPVRIEPVDGSRVAVLGGLEADQRVVVRAAELLNQVK